jgi:hypothetical protein
MTLRSAAELIAEINAAHEAESVAVVRRPRCPSAVVPDFLHRGTDGYVPLSRKVGTEWQELGSVPAAQLRGLFADEVMAAAMESDSYFGLHGMYSAGRYKSRHQLNGLLPPLRNTQSVRWLTCCGLDLDSYNVGLDVHGTMAAVMRLVDEGSLPPPSLFTMSRGLWVIWRLHDREHTNEPIRSYPDSVVARWTKLQKAFHAVCATIGSDSSVCHAATVTRIPGSVNTKSGRRVAYMLPADVHGQPFSYTLDELESLMRPHLKPVVDVVALPAPKAPANPKLSKRGKQGWSSRWHHMNSRLSKLRDMRGGWKVGHRNAAMFYVAMTLKALRADEKEVRRVLAQHLEGMAQPDGDRLTLEHALRAYRSCPKPHTGGPNHQTVADALDVTVEEAGVLSADKRHLFPPALKYRMSELPALPKVSRKEATERRREEVRGICERLTAAGHQPTGPDVEAHLLAAGIPASRKSVLADMAHIGCPSTLAHREKPQPEPQPTLF